MIPRFKNSDLIALMDTECDEVIAERFKALALDATHLRAFNNKDSYILHKAAELGLVKTTEAIFNNLEQQTAVSLIAIKDSGDNVLHLAARYGRTEIVELLLAKAPELIREKTSSGENALHLAAWEGHPEVVKLLLAKDPELIREKNSTNDNALHLAAGHGHTEVVELLLAKGPELIREKTSSGENALHLAAWEGHTEIVELLLAKDSELIREKVSAGYNALHIAAMQGHTEVVKLLLANDSELIREKASTAYNALNIEAMDNALHIAVKYAHTEVVKLLLANDSELIREKNSAGNNALHLAAWKGDPEVVKLLLAKDDSELICKKTSFGNNALHIAAMHGRTEVVKLLLAKDDSELILGRNSLGNNALNIAAKYCHSEVVELLLTKAPELICVPASSSHTADEAKNAISTLVPAFFKTEIYKEDPTERLFRFLKMLKSQKYLNANFNELLSLYKTDIQALVNNEKCARHKTIENGESSLKLAEDLGVENYLLKEKETNLLDIIKSVRSDLVALSYIQSQNIATDDGTPIKEIVENIRARYADSGYDFHPQIRKKICDLTEHKEWKLNEESPFLKSEQKRLHNIGLFLNSAAELEMSLVCAEVESDWAKKSLNSKPQKRITDFFRPEQDGKRKREDEDFVQVGKEVTAQGPSPSSSFFEPELTEKEMELGEGGSCLINDYGIRPGELLHKRRKMA